MDKKIAEEKVREMFDSLTPEQLAELQNSFAETMGTIKNESVKKLETLKVKKTNLETEKKALGSDYTNWDKKQELNESIDNLNMFILNQENVVKVLENNGLIYNLTDQHGFQYTNIPDFRKVDSTEFNFDENNVLTIPIPKYIPFIDEAKFREHSYVFDAIRITEDSYLICLGNYSTKQKEKNVFCIATLDQLVLIIDYYYLKEKAFNIEIAKRSNERSKEHYFSLSEEKRRYYMFQQGIYYSLSAINKKKISKEDFEALDLEGREKYYLPIKRHAVKRIASKLTDNSMYVSFHNMYEDFIDKTKTIITKNGKRYANEIVLSYWKDFAKMINYKLSDIRTQREDYSDTYKQAMETSFGESNVDTILKDKYGILIKRQNGDKIKPFEIDLIEKSWVKIQNAYGNLKAESVKNNLKISHSGEKLMFSMKALGVYIPLMGTIGVSNKLGEVDFRSTLSHEVAHFIDNFIGKLNGKRWATDDYESLAGKIAFTFRNSMNKSKNDQTDYINATKECFARAFQQYFGMKTEGEDAITKNVDNKVAPEGIEIWKHPNFVNKFTFKDEVEPLIEQFLKENLDVFETTVDIDGTNDLAPITVEENKVVEYSIGQKLTGDEVYNIVSEYDSREGTDMVEFADENISKTVNYKVENINIKDLIEKDVNLSEYIKDNKDDYDKGKLVDFKKYPILLGDDEYGSKNIVKDGYGRVTQLYVNGEKEVYAFVPIDEVKTEEPEESIEDLIEGLKVMIEYSEGAEKEELENTIEGLKLLL
jgi:hypothetical protein